MTRLMMVMMGLFLLVGLGVTACDTDSVANTVYTCSDCSKTCGSATEGSCEFTCTGGACDFSCPGGNCAVHCDHGDECSLACPGGSCAMDCGDDTTTCEITECTSACALTCGGATDCSNSCGVMAGCTQG